MSHVENAVMNIFQIMVTELENVMNVGFLDFQRKMFKLFTGVFLNE